MLSKLDRDPGDGSIHPEHLDSRSRLRNEPHLVPIHPQAEADGVAIGHLGAGPNKSCERSYGESPHGAHGYPTTQAPAKTGLLP